MRHTPEAHACCFLPETPYLHSEQTSTSSRRGVCCNHVMGAMTVLQRERRKGDPRRGQRGGGRNRCRDWRGVAKGGSRKERQGQREGPRRRERRKVGPDQRRCRLGVLLSGPLREGAWPRRRRRARGGSLRAVRQTGRGRASPRSLRSAPRERREPSSWRASCAGTADTPCRERRRGRGQEGCGGVLSDGPRRRGDARGNREVGR
mmetsp:Transcript_52836/g.123755  ORF Transcript_52836/g.123755 Transcript_52836/m.123755 type:complete len:205 (+) Transcript_52836:464-1078(+)